MSKKADLIGKIFGRWTVIGEGDPPKKGKQVMWHCRCECGTERDVASANLVHGFSKSCGCLADDSRHSRFIDLTGKKFHRLTVLRRDETSNTKHSKWICRCDCGKVCSVAGGNLQNGHTKSCGCLSSEVTAARNRANATHGDTNTRLYRSWCSMWTRCTDPKCASYCRYGGRGIKVCEEWRDYFKFREWALSVGYDYNANLTIDRIDPDGDYCPENCRFLTQQQQNATKRNAVRISYNGKTQCLKEWAREYNIAYLTLYQRLTTLGWGFEKALTTPVRKTGAKQEKVAS